MDLLYCLDVAQSFQFDIEACIWHYGHWIQKALLDMVQFFLDILQMVKVFQSEVEV